MPTFNTRQIRREEFSLTLCKIVDENILDRFVPPPNGHRGTRTMSALGDMSLILYLPTCHRPQTVTPHSSATEKGSTCNEVPNFDASATSLYNVEYYLALDSS